MEEQNYVLATTGIVADMVQRVAKEKVKVVSLMGYGVDPHLYKPTEGDLIKIKNAKAIFYNGLHLEGKMTEILVRQKKIKPTLALAETVPKDSLIMLSSNTPDPHIWFDPILWKMTLPAITQVLVTIQPEDRQFFEESRIEEEKKIDTLHQWIQNQIELIPKSNRILITSHDAFSYFGRRYQVEVYGLQGISTVSEFGLLDITKLVDFVIEKKVPAVFVESSVPKRAMEAVVEGAKKRNHKVIIGGELYSDAMGSPGTIESTYEGMIQSNVMKFVNAMSKEAKQ